jgi:hypothetical protein
MPRYTLQDNGVLSNMICGCTQAADAAASNCLSFCSMSIVQELLLLFAILCRRLLANAANTSSADTTECVAKTCGCPAAWHS